MKLARNACLLMLTSAASALFAQSPLGTGITYQGQLKQNGAAMNGTVNLRFSLWDAAGTGSPPSGGNQIGSAQQVTNVPISNGLILVTLNDTGQFGSSAFNGQARWLQVEVCADSSCNSRTALAPRQPVSAVPFAAFAAAPWTQPSAGGTTINYNGGSVGIGTSAPTATLHVNGNIGVGVAQIPVGLTSELGGTATPILNLDVNFRQPNHLTSSVGGAIRIDSRNDLADPLFQFISRNAGLNTESIVAAITQTGNLGLGTPAPTARLEVRGDVKLGTSGQLFAPGGVERLRIIRGSATTAGVITDGTGFTASSLSTTQCQINFTPPFSGLPTVVASLVNSNYGGDLNQIIQDAITNDHVILHACCVANRLEAFNFTAIGPP